MKNMRIINLTWVVRAESLDGRFVCDVYKNAENELFLSGIQIIECIGYVNPELELSRLQTRHNDRLKKYSVLAEESKSKSIAVFYNIRGVLEICRYVHKSQTIDFLAWCYDTILEYGV